MTMLYPLSSKWDSSVHLPNKIKHNFHPLKESLILRNNLSEELGQPLIYLICYELTFLSCFK
jgi:hypothetical protein